MTTISKKWAPPTIYYRIIFPLSIDNGALSIGDKVKCVNIGPTQSGLKHNFIYEIIQILDPVRIRIKLFDSEDSSEYCALSVRF